MAEFYLGNDGIVMAREAAGGAGGGVTSYVTRPASSYEAMMFHEREVAVTEAAAVAAKDAHAAHVKVVEDENKAAAEAATVDATTQRVGETDAQFAARKADAAALPDATLPHTPQPGPHSNPADGPNPAFGPNAGMQNQSALNQGLPNRDQGTQNQGLPPEIGANPQNQGFPTPNPTPQQPQPQPMPA